MNENGINTVAVAEAHIARREYEEAVVRMLEAQLALDLAATEAYDAAKRMEMYA